jgi:gamma-glutamyl-gamma-aminobutyrate hydrolase PuuD
MALIAAALERRIPIFAIRRGCRNFVATGGRCIAACSSRTTCSSTGKILNCRLSYNTPRLMKFRFRREDCCLN